MPGVRFTISADVFALFRGLRVAVVVASGVDNRSVNHGVESLLHDAWRDAAGLELPNPQSHPRVAAWREAFRSIGISPRDFPSSIEALLRRAMKGGQPPRISPLVDLYNAVSLRHLVPAGGFDLAGIDGDLELRLSREGDHFEPLGGGRAEPVPAGEVSYAVGTEILTRHFVWRQARRAALLPSTTDVLLLSEILGAIEDDVTEAVLDGLRSGVADLLGARAVHGHVL
jgi:DNA/RNA-binding domain of Phe-tRNA-synthetase-like protein